MIGTTKQDCFCATPKVNVRGHSQRILMECKGNFMLYCYEMIPYEHIQRDINNYNLDPTSGSMKCSVKQVYNQSGYLFLMVGN